MDPSPISLSERRAFRVFLAAVALAAAWLVLWPLLAPVVLAVLAVVVVQPAHRRLERWLGEGSLWAAAASTLGLTALVGLPAYKVGGLFLDQVRELLNELIDGEIRSRLAAVVERGANWLSELAEALLGHRFEVGDVGGEALRRLGSVIYEHIPDALTQAGRLTLGLLVLYLVLFYLLLRGGEVVALIVRLSPLGTTHSRRILDRLEATIQGVFLGALATALFQGVVGSVGFWLTGFENYLVWGALIAGAGLVPVVGTGLVWVPAAVYLVLLDQPGAALAMAVVGGVVSIADNLLKPLVIQGRASVPPLLVFLGVFGGLRALGPMGLIYGPLLMACLAETVRIYLEDFAPAADAETLPSPSPAGGDEALPGPSPAAGGGIPDA